MSEIAECIILAIRLATAGVFLLSVWMLIHMAWSLRKSDHEREHPTD